VVDNDNLNGKGKGKGKVAPVFSVVDNTVHNLLRVDIQDWIQMQFTNRGY
jgi:hypothetical protein